ncbi:hypothetical protein VI817_001959 [Penicillium citrinum]|uniref:N-acetyltransferase domain-containing protein n=1 Tax=Penicillium hetheringtonii TaxID=911720 RepID=A0AAD6E545_9EURO|nr:hypothetical protein N7450_002002 [Penicillium hetheringtonii]KAK5807701.1 hypothetical protein VI817_001959 [Penicillium citrinum]
MDLIESLDSRWSSSSSSSFSSSTSPSPSPSPLISPTTTNTNTSLNNTSSTSHSETDIPKSVSQNAFIEEEEYEEYIATTTSDLTCCLRLIADSIAEQRQIASRGIIHSLPFFSGLIFIISALALWLVNGGVDWVSWAFSCVSVLAGALRTVEYLTARYLDTAEKLNWEWKWALRKSSSSDATSPDRVPKSIYETREDSVTNFRGIVLITKWEDITVGTLLLRVPLSDSKEDSKKAPLIRAWTVKQSYRHIGIGRSLLRRAIEMCRSNGWEDPSFAIDHANSLRILPEWFNGEMEKRDIQARQMLQRELQE